MPKFVRKILVCALGWGVAASLVGGISVEGPSALLLAGFVLGLVNALVRPIVVIFTLPLTFLTLGLFLFVINGLMLLLVDRFVAGVTVSGLVPAIWGAIIIGLVSWLVGDQKNRKKSEK